ncbi:fluoride efflux transporter CrcB [Rubritalea marina]|uniref:fluoride efflux transporter CrcB n=1 Tax=Rubritalea marina TaxID=361055 RepID=UPI000374155F|nr:fluoride efflux transporter CrcB [Rubritalea marina]
MTLHQFICIFLGGGLGACSRFALSSWIHSSARFQGFPWGVFACNLIGCLLIGLAAGLIKSHHPSWIHPLFVTGLFGGFTTFSSFALDTHNLIQNQHLGLAATYSLGTLVIGTLLCYVGYTLTSS